MHEAVKTTVTGFLASADRVLPGNYSAVLYGSTVRGDYVEGRSDVNLLLVTEDASFPLLRALAPALRAWRDKSYEPPLVFTRQEWSRATDVFPIEITDMKVKYELLRGSDPVAPASVNRADLRQALESEFRGKLMRLRQAYATFADEEKELTPLARSSASSILVLLRATLSLLGRPEAPPDGATRTVQAAGAAADFPPEPLLEIVQHRDERNWRCSAGVFEGYVTAVARTARHVDQLQTGES